MLNTDPAYGTATSSITTDEIRAFVGSNSHYYIQRFSRLNITGIERFCPTWNWSCFGFTFLWMLYRKMYFLAVLTFIVFCIPGVNILLHIFAGVVGNYLYYRHVKGKILEIRAVNSPQHRDLVFQEVGGVHQWAIILGIIVSIILGLLIVFFFAAISAYMGHLVTLTI
jgi:hypothetical protein